MARKQMLFQNLTGFFPSLSTLTMDNPFRFNVEIWRRRAATMQTDVIILKQVALWHTKPAAPFAAIEKAAFVK